MSEWESPTHQAEITGIPDGDSAETEPRDRARRDTEERDELRVHDRAPQPRPQSATRFRPTGV